ncbi:MAG: septal ring lytic transglycosylase RlpA family protein [Bacteroidetes bacterium]|nr:septal ring lytic transglycosylase RlpA family protein [Bacteroidota bacterium]
MNKKIVIAVFAGSMLANQVNAQHHKHRHTSRAALKKDIKTQIGTASFYANKFNGRRTANGEIFSQKKLTAASNTLPLNIWVRVTNLHNKKAVIVRITDRMHKNNKRLIDLSKAAAHQLGYTGRGLTRVQVDVIGRKKPSETPITAANK